MSYCFICLISIFKILKVCCVCNTFPPLLSFGTHLLRSHSGITCFIKSSLAPCPVKMVRALPLCSCSTFYVPPSPLATLCSTFCTHASHLISLAALLVEEPVSTPQAWFIASTQQSNRLHEWMPYCASSYFGSIFAMLTVITLINSRIWNNVTDRVLFSP